MTPGTLGTAWTVARKETHSALRDRQTFLYAVVLPLVLYPAIFWVMIQAQAYLAGRDEKSTVRVALAGESSDVETALAGGELRPVVTEPVDPALDVTAATELLHSRHDLDAVLVFPSGAEDAATLVYDGTRSSSRIARERVVARLGELAEEKRRGGVEAAGADPDRLAPFVLESVNLASTRATSAFVFSLILPLMFVLMAVMGAFYPAVDCTAGEKERGTAETTLLLPAPRLGIVLGKVLAVSALALLATLLNLAGLVLAAEPLIAALDTRLEFEVPWSELLFVLPVVGVFLFTTSAILVACAAFTETFKQGQALLGALQLGFLVPAMVAVMPGVELTPALALVPVVQTVLAFKAVLANQDVPAWTLVLATLAQLGWAALALLVAVRVGTREAFSAGGARGLRAALALWRSQEAPR